MLTNGDMIPALLTRMSAVTPCFLSVAKSWSTAAGELRSAGMGITLVVGAAASISFFVASSWDCERADIMTVSAPARAKDVAMPFPIPLLPPIEN